MSVRASVARLVLILAVILLAGCATHSPDAEAQAQAQGAAADDAKCKSYGLTPGTPEFEKCLSKLADQRAQTETDSRAGVASRLQGRLPPGMDTSAPPR
jgi:outer membrane PBP1 activator LpoA protein